MENETKTDQAKRADLIKFLAKELGVSEAAFKKQADKGREMRGEQKKALIIQAHIKMQKCCTDIATALNELEEIGINVTAQRVACLSFVELCSEQAIQLKTGVL